MIPADIMLDFCSKIDEQLEKIAGNLSAELGLHVTKEHVVWAHGTVLRQWPHLNDSGVTQMVTKLVRDAIASNADIKALLWEEDEQAEQ